MQGVEEGWYRGWECVPVVGDGAGCLCRYCAVLDAPTILGYYDPSVSYCCCFLLSVLLDCRTLLLLLEKEGGRGRLEGE